MTLWKYARSFPRLKIHDSSTFAGYLHHKFRHTLIEIRKFLVDPCYETESKMNYYIALFKEVDRQLWSVAERCELGGSCPEVSPEYYRNPLAYIDFLRGKIIPFFIEHISSGAIKFNKKTHYYAVDEINDLQDTINRIRNRLFIEHNRFIDKQEPPECDLD